ncbi:conserved hypothetical protein [Talaromyces stipitatus ATCC 10500]|uniref:Fungal death-pathway protein SesB domain-containing protein n=1 Tax=Talaromyces stipitatus (strain ATCC 10500 / CBS 375.48 / QM 6759 / NRRL 1006) TaxID=441959 RepID=B8MGG4_TALSN|nr:uncharacterized protein TSTA_013830 [Talaromyces stipitatus ATCC 10500]EED16284.1 conserved hypothetical protein [Talaromyces stipitatus ATCC 10500]
MSINIIKDPSDARLDIILVSGLKIDQKDWTSAENSIFWPEKLLATQIPKARILVFEYDEDLTLDVFWNKRDLISSNSDDLVNSLMDERRGEKAERPLVFIAHCLGGLVVENALMRANKNEKKRQLVTCAIGLLLLGTPHYQSATLSQAKKYFQLAQKDVPSDSDLQALSKHVLAIPQSFAEFIQSNPINVESFYEGAPVIIADDQEIELVEESLAKLPGDFPDPTMLKGNHHSMSRFESERDKDYKNVSRVLADWVEDLPQPEEKGTTNNISNASFSGSTNYGYQLGQNTGTQSGFTFGAR